PLAMTSAGTVGVGAAVNGRRSSGVQPKPRSMGQLLPKESCANPFTGVTDDDGGGGPHDGGNTRGVCTITTPNAACTVMARPVVVLSTSTMCVWQSGA